MALTTTISFRIEDKELRAFLKERSRTPQGYALTGVAIRDILYEYMALIKGDYDE